MTGENMLVSVLTGVSLCFAASAATVDLSGSGWTADGEPVSVPHCYVLNVFDDEIVIERRNFGSGAKEAENWKA